jgi:phosphoglycerol transferase MdoB-like AlkP superfamily enzyme
MDMNNSCPVCSASFEPEPGFYFGAMFISYAFTVAIMFVNWVILYLFLKPETSTYIYAFLVSVFIATPFSYRYSRLIWLYWFGGHKRQS